MGALVAPLVDSLDLGQLGVLAFLVGLAVGFGITLTVVLERAADHPIAALTVVTLSGFTLAALIGFMVTGDDLIGLGLGLILGGLAGAILAIATNGAKRRERRQDKKRARDTRGHGDDDDQ